MTDNVIELSSAASECLLSDISESLEYYAPYIITFVRRQISLSLAVLDLEIDEIVQEVRIKFWKALRVRNIQYPKAYIKRIVRNGFVDYVRRRKSLLPLPTDEDGELYQGKLMVTPGEGMSDPAYEYEEAEALDDLMAQTADAVSVLPRRQQRAMICSLKEQVDDFLQFVEFFKVHEVDVVSLEWPDDDADVLRLKASISAARKKIEQRMNVTFV